MSTKLIGSAVDAHNKISGFGIPARMVKVVQVIHHSAMYVPHDVYHRTMIATIICKSIVHISRDVIREVRVTAIVDSASETMVYVAHDVIREA